MKRFYIIYVFQGKQKTFAILGSLGPVKFSIVIVVVSHKLSEKKKNPTIAFSSLFLFFGITLRSKSMRLCEGSEQKGHSHTDQTKQHHRHGAKAEPSGPAEVSVVKHRDGINRTNPNRPQLRENTTALPQNKNR